MSVHTFITCPLTGKLTISGICRVTHKPWFVVGVKPDDYKRWREGEYIQNVMPYLTADEREELISGTSKEGWDILFKEEDA
jgi:hypothetical protein